MHVKKTQQVRQKNYLDIFLHCYSRGSKFKVFAIQSTYLTTQNTLTLRKWMAFSEVDDNRYAFQKLHITVNKSLIHHVMFFIYVPPPPTHFSRKINILALYPVTMTAKILVQRKRKLQIHSALYKVIRSFALIFPCEIECLCYSIPPHQILKIYSQTFRMLW